MRWGDFGRLCVSKIDRPGCPGQWLAALGSNLELGLGGVDGGREVARYGQGQGGPRQIFRFPGELFALSSLFTPHTACWGLAG